MSTLMVETLAQLGGPAVGYAAADGSIGSSAVDLGIGEARYRMPEPVRAELTTAAGAWLEQVWYSVPSGVASLRETYLGHLNGGATSPSPRGPAAQSFPSIADIDQVLVTGGGKEAAWLAVQYLAGRRRSGREHDVGGAASGDVAVLVPLPGWAPYGLWLRAIGCHEVPYDPLALAADPGLLRQLVRDSQIRPTVLVLNYPNNPTGASVDQAAMDALIAAAVELGVSVVSDEVYRAFAHGHVSAVRAPAFDPHQHLVVDSCSKWLAVAGLRVGFLVASPSVIRDLTLFRSSYASCTSVAAQHLAATLMRSAVAVEWLAGVRSDVETTRLAVAQQLELMGLCVTSHGALYVWCRRPQLRDVPARPPVARITDGRGFGSADHVRICTAREGLDVVAAAAAVHATVSSGADAPTGRR